MSFNFKAAAAASSILSIAAFASLAGSSAVTASDLPDRVDSALLPQSVIEAAIVEQSTIPDHIEAPTPAAPADMAGARAQSLSALVAHHSGAQVEGAEAECLAAAVYFESKGEPLVGQLAVAEVILNRAKSGRFPSSICGVVKQPSQFSFVRGGGFPPIARSSRGWREAVAISKVAQDRSWSSGVGKALFFHANHVSPGWRLTRVAALGNHIFYR
jgi:N-acetylmuramoyl-L-alanine amidase